MADPTQVPHADPSLPHWRTLLLEEVSFLSTRRPWGLALQALGVVHLVYFLVAQALHLAAIYNSRVLLTLWSAEVATVVLTMRLVAGKGWLYDAPVVALIFRVWVTFLILSFNVVMLNGMLGFDHETDFFKAVWCTLASFGFATMAWLFGFRYLIPAFQMYFTGLLIYKFPAWGYLIHGASWCLALQYVGLDVSRRRSRNVERLGDPS